MFAVRRSLALSLVLTVLVGLFIGLAACDDGIVDSGPDPDPDPVQDDEPLPELPGDPDDSVLEAIYDFSADVEIADEEVSEDPETGAEVVRRQLQVQVERGATVQEFNEVLDRYEARISNMLPARPYVIVRIPDPGSLDTLQSVIRDLKAEPAIETVWADMVPAPDVLPEHIAPKIGDMVNRVQQDRLKHHLAVRAHAAWNVQGAIEEGPWMVIYDNFGNQRPSTEHFAGAFMEPADFKDVLFPSKHGYHVLGIMNADFDQTPDATGIFPDQFRIRAVDGKSIGYLAAEYEIIRRIREIRKQDPSANIVVNASMGQPTPPWQTVDEGDGRRWRNLVNPNDPMGNEENLEEHFLFFTSAGNDPSAPIYENSSWTYATFGPNMDDLLGNLHAVENRWTNPKNVELEGVDKAERPEPGCPFFDPEDGSTMGGSLSAIGMNVYSLIDASNGSTAVESGTSMASPQAAGTAGFMWAVNSSLGMLEVKEYIQDTARDIVTNQPDATFCNPTEPAPVIDTYDAVLAAGGDHVRRVLLDVNETGTFDETDIEVFLSEWDERDGQLDYSRYDLNGTGQTGGDAIDRFDLNHDISFSTVSQTIEGEDVTFDEEAVTDADVLCYYSYSDLFGGNHQARAELLADLCLGVEGTQATISGTITDEETGEGIEDATVTGADPSTGDELFGIDTDGSGNYETTFNVVDSVNEIAIEATADGYESVEGQVTVESNIMLDIALSPEDTSTPNDVYVPGDGYQYFVSPQTYDSDTHIPSLLRDDFGSSAELVDWSDLKEMFADDLDELLNFLETVGLTEYRDDAFVKRNGSRFRAGSRHYFMQRHDGNVPGGWAVHDQMHSNTVSLGSWPTTKKALVRIPE